MKRGYASERKQSSLHIEAHRDHTGADGRGIGGSDPAKVSHARRHRQRIKELRAFPINEIKCREPSRLQSLEARRRHVRFPKVFQQSVVDKYLRILPRSRVGAPQLLADATSDEHQFLRWFVE